jgi:limonene-1,2-epoxide hydrolase
MKMRFSITLLLISLWISSPSAMRAQASSSSQLEQDAIKVVNAWSAAWATKDAEKVGEYMAENCEFRADPKEPELKKGRAEFVNSMKRLIGRGITVQVIETHAMGGEAGVAVLQKRIDSITINGQRRDIPLAAFFRVKDGKIQEWLDMPLIVVNAPPAPGAPNAQQ